MKIRMIFIGAGLFLFVFAAAFTLFSRQQQNSVKSEAAMNAKSVHDFTMETIEGEMRELSAYKGKVLMIINTASKCGYTPQYETLEQLYRTYKDKGLRILAFPANNFLWQEPGTNEEIKKFCTENYDVTFDLFAKISVKGGDKDPLYQYITEYSPVPGEIKWNFQKYLVDRDGTIVTRFAHTVDPMAKEVREKVEALLSATAR